MYLPLAAFFRGYRLIVDSRAHVRLSHGLESEFWRKVHTLAGNSQILGAYPQLLTPRNRMLLHFLSYKFVAPATAVRLPGHRRAELLVARSVVGSGDRLPGRLLRRRARRWLDAGALFSKAPDLPGARLRDPDGRRPLRHLRALHARRPPVSATYRAPRSGI